MKALITLMLWCVLLVLCWPLAFMALVLCWPLAFMALVLWPIVWLLALPFRLIGITFTALFTCLNAVLTLPARLLGWKPDSSGHAVA